MSGYSTYCKWKRIEDWAKTLGFRIGNSRHGWGRDVDTDVVALFPAEDAMPVYARDCEFFTGTFNQLEVWLAGWERAQQYDMLLRVSDEKKRKKAEDKERERQKKEADRLAKREMYAILANKSEAQVDKLIK